LPTITAEDVKAFASAAGFDLCGISAVEAFPELRFLEEWIARGYHGEMHYMARNAERRADVRAVLPSVRSVIMLGTIYNTDRPRSIDNRSPGQAVISRYAWGDDYHDLLTQRMERVVRSIEATSGPFEHRAYVDTGPVQERVYARYAGLGWIGKNTCLINEQLGSWVFLSAILSDLELRPDVPPADRCGTCTRCIDACPTGALVAPYQLDARRCLSYLTIELKGPIPLEHRAQVGHHAYGCDICQDVCPWNRRAAVSSDGTWVPRAGLEAPPLLGLWNRSDDDLRTLLKGSPMKRAGLRRLRRNIAVGLGNSGDPAAVAALEAQDEATCRDELVREHVAWAVEKLRG
jgi:epoxyqueuosine reductase